MTLTLTAVAAPTLRLSGDRKTSPLVRRQASKEAVLINNAFGLPAGRAGSCGNAATDICEGPCYADAITTLFKASGKLVQANYDALLACGDDVDAMVDLLDPLVDQFERDCEKRGVDKLFRIHWSGEFYSVAYAMAWAIVIDRHADTTFWVYTRSFLGFNAPAVLADLPNCSLYLSVDAENVDVATAVLADLPATVKVAALADTHAEAQQLIDRMGRSRALACPENAGRLPLVVGSGRKRPDVGENGRGACIACGACVYARRDVTFSFTGR